MANKFRKYSYFDETPMQNVPETLIYTDGGYYKIGVRDLVYVWRGATEWVRSTKPIEAIKKEWKRQFLSVSRETNKKQLAKAFIESGDFMRITPQRAAKQ